jgi:integrase
VAQKKLIFRHHIAPALGRVPLDQVAQEIEPFKALLRKKGLAAKTVNNYVTVLSKMLRYAEERKVIDEAPRVRLLKVPPSEFDFLTYEEFEQLLDGAREEPEWYTAILVAGEAGLRRGEIIGLEKRDIDFDAGNIRVMRSAWKGQVVPPKSGRPRIVPMTVRLATALKAQRHLRGPRVFCQMDGKPLTQGLTEWPLRRMCKRAGLRTIGWHALRHTFCSHLAMRGAAPTAIQELAGHESFETTKRYLHLAPVMLRETVKLLEGRPIEAEKRRQSAVE